MMFYECVYETECCGHTLCDDCAVGFMDTTQHLDAEGNADSESGPIHSVPLTPRCSSSELLPVNCPFCRNEGLGLKVITPGEAGDHLRSYEDSPMRLSRNGTPSSAVQQSRDTPGNARTKPSPLKVGDSFEKMKAKMVPLEEGRPLTVSENDEIPVRTPLPGRPPIPPSSIHRPVSRQPALSPIAGSQPAEDSLPGMPVLPDPAVAVQSEAPTAAVEATSEPAAVSATEAEVAAEPTVAASTEAEIEAEAAATEAEVAAEPTVVASTEAATETTAAVEQSGEVAQDQEEVAGLETPAIVNPVAETPQRSSVTAAVTATPLGGEGRIDESVQVQAAA